MRAPTRRRPRTSPNRLKTDHVRLATTHFRKKDAMTDHNDDQNDLAALYYASADGSDSEDEGGAQSSFDALNTYAPAEAEEAGSELGVIHSAAAEAPAATETEDEDRSFPLF